MNKSKALIIVDVQNDGFEGGLFPVPGSESIIPYINKLIKIVNFNNIFITKDWHPLNHSSFAINH
jgi:nicotinamidase/pyrazinamidase